jgi:hypothetical protein
MMIGSKEVEIKWKDGEVLDLVSKFPPDLKLTAMAGVEGPPETKGAIQCYKCWVNTETGDWVCLPTTC